MSSERSQNSKQSKGKKYGKPMTLDQFHARIEEEKTKSKQKVVKPPPVAAWGGSRAPASVSLTSVMEEQNYKTTEESIPVAKSNIKDMRKGTRMFVDFPQREGLVSTRDVSDYSYIPPQITSVNELRYSHVTPIEMGYSDYHRFCEDRHKRREEEIKSYKTLSEMAFFMIQAPEMMRNICIAELLEHNIKIVSTINGRREITKEVYATKDRKPSSYSLIMSRENAFFELSKNGHIIFADFRPLFMRIDEVQVVFEKDGEMDFSRGLMMFDVSVAAEQIIRLLR